MLIEPPTVAKLLSEVYVERTDGQWKTVTNCIEELLRGDVTKLSGIPIIAFDLAEHDSPIYDEVVRRANKLNDRTGKAGHLEVRELAKAAIKIALLSKDEYLILAAHTSRVGFNRKLDQQFYEIIKASAIKTRASIDKRKRLQKKFEPLKDPIQPGQWQSSLKERDDYFYGELMRRDELYAITLNCVTGQVSPWSVIKKIESGNNIPYPCDHEFMLAQAAFTFICIDEKINLNKLPDLPVKLHTDDAINCPLLSCILALQNGNAAPDYIYSLDIPIESFIQQLFLEIIYLQSVAHA